MKSSNLHLSTKLIALFYLPCCFHHDAPPMPTTTSRGSGPRFFHTQWFWLWSHLLIRPWENTKNYEGKPWKHKQRHILIHKAGQTTLTFFRKNMGQIDVKLIQRLPRKCTSDEVILLPKLRRFFLFSVRLGSFHEGWELLHGSFVHRLQLSCEFL